MYHFSEGEIDHSRDDDCDGLVSEFDFPGDKCQLDYLANWHTLSHLYII